MLDVIRANAQSWGVKIAFGIIILVFVFWGVGGLSGTPSTVVITVNKEPITVQQFQAEAEQLERQLRAQMPGIDSETLKAMRFRERVVQQLIMRELLTQEAKRAGVTVTPTELRQVIESIPAFHNAQGTFDADTYLRVLKAQNDSAGRFEASLRSSLLLEKLQRDVTAGAFVSEAEVKDLYMYDGERRILEYALFPLADYASKITVSDADVQAWYETNQNMYRVPPQADVEYLLVGAESLAAGQPVDDAAIAAEYEKNAARYTRPERVQARHILIPVAADAAQDLVDKAKSDIEALEKRIREGKEDFAALAQEFSKDGSAQSGGDLGWFSREQMVAPFADAAFALKPGDVSAPVRTQFGFHLIKAEGHEPESKLPLAEVKDEIKQRLAMEQAAGKVQDVLEQVQLAVIGGKDLAAAGEPYQLKAQSTGLKDGQELAQLLGIKPENVATLLATASGTSLDTPFVTKTGYLLVKVKEAKPESIRPLTEVAPEIKARLEKERAMQMATAEADKALKGMGAELPADLKKKAAKSQPMARDGYLPGLNDAGGPNAGLGKAAFDAQPGQWLPVVFPLDEGAALVRVAEIVRPDEETWKAASAQIRDAVIGAKREQMFRGFLSALRAQASIEIKDERILTD